MFRLLLLLAVVLLSSCVGAGQIADTETPTPPSNSFTPDDLAEHPLFDPDTVLQVAITMDPDDWAELRAQSRSFAGEFAGDCRSEPFSSPYTYFPGDLEVNGETLSSIGLRKKGFIGSQNLKKPSLRLNLDEYVPGAELHGVDNITLNNGVQDPALVRQCLTYGLFQRAGLPASRCGFARVRVNDEDLGIYVHVEPVKRSFLRERFGNDDGDLYEGTLSDVDARWLDTFEPKNTDTDPDLGPLRRLAEDLAGEGPLEETLDAHIDLEQYLTFQAMEVWAAHWDGYAGNQNNFFIYRDPARERLVFLPWGVDGTLSAFEGRGPGHFSTGLIANRVLADPSLRARYLDRVDALGDAVWSESWLLGEVDRMESLLEEELGPATPFDPIDEVREFVENQRGLLEGAEIDVDTFRAPFCLQEFGSLDASFETTWGSSNGGFDGIWDAGDLDLTVIWGENGIPFTAEGVMAGPAEQGASATTLVMAGEFGDPDAPELMIPYLVVPNGPSQAGQSLPVGESGGPFAKLLYSGPDSGYEPVEAAVLSGGAVTFDEFEAAPGATLSGTLTTSLYGWAEVD